MATYIPYTPTGAIAKALFNFDVFDISNFKLTGTVNVSVSDAFTFQQYLFASSIISSDIYTSLGSGNGGWSAAQLTNINLITSTFSNFINLNFSPVANYSGFTPTNVGSVSDINISLIYRTDGSFSGQSALGVDTIFGYEGSRGDIVLNVNGFGSFGLSNDYSLNSSSFGFHTLMHEIGHSLGLSHPHSSSVSTITEDYAQTINLGFGELGFQINSPLDMNKEYFSIMSYDDQMPAGAPDTFAQTPMILDVIALQSAYGEGPGSSGSGNDVVTAGGGGGVNAYRTYFDTGGMDSINLANYVAGAYLHMGTSIVGATHLVGVSMSTADAGVLNGGADPSSLRWFYGEYENATGSSADDLIIDNALNNTVSAGSGNDILASWNGGVDTFVGGSGNDTYLTDFTGIVIVENAGEGVDEVKSSSDYTLAANVENLTLTGSSNLTGTGNSLQNILIGNAGSNTLSGMEGADVLSGGDGDDTLIGSGGNDSVDGGTGFDTAVYAGARNGYLVVRSAGNLTITDINAGDGDSGSDTLTAVESAQFRDATQNLINHAPVVTPTVATQIVLVGQAVAVSTLFAVRDDDGDAITNYRFFDSGTGGGQFRVNGVAQGAGQGIDVTAATFASTVYTGGAIAGTETLWVQAYDGQAWTPWVSWQMNTRVTNAAPTVTINGSLRAQRGEWVSGGDARVDALIDAADPDGDALVRGELRNLGGGGAYLWVSGAGYVAANQVVSFTQADLEAGRVWGRGASVDGTDRFEVRYTDGLLWSNWTGFDVVTKGPNRAPVATPTAATQSISVGQAVAVSTLFGMRDDDGDAITNYRFFDSGTGGGQFRVNGVAQGAGQGIDVTAATLANTAYAAGAIAGTETLWVQAYDGQAWTPWVSWQMNTQRVGNAAPTVTINGSLRAQRGEWVSGGDARVDALIDASDPDGDALVRGELRNLGGGGAYLWVSGAGYVAANQVVSFTQADLEAGRVWGRGASVDGTDRFEVRYTDGLLWSNWTGFDVVTKGPNRAPVATPTAATQSISVGQAVAVSTLFGMRDDDGDAITNYRFFDSGTGGGQFRVNGVAQGAGQGIDVTAATLANTAYAAGAIAGTETLWVQAYDGQAWTPWVSWQMNTQRVGNAAPTVTINGSLRAQRGEWVSGGDARVDALIDASDPDGDALVRGELRNLGGGGAYLWVSGVGYVAANQVVSFTQADLDAGRVWGRGASVDGTDRFEVRYTDGLLWSNWTGFDVVTKGPNRAPVATPTAATQSISVGQAVAVSTLFGMSDDDGDAITNYRFFDSGTGGGHFRVNGVAQAAGRGIDVAAATLANTAYAGGGIAGSETLWVQAYDGQAWTPWVSWQMNTALAG